MIKLSQEQAEFLLKAWLRIVATTMIFALMAVLMPTRWIEDAVDTLEPGTNATLLIQYLARALSMFYFMVGGLFWIFSTDIHRYAKPIHFSAYCYIMASTIALMFIVTMQFTIGGISQILFSFMVTDFIAAIIMALIVLLLLFKCDTDFS